MHGRIGSMSNVRVWAVRGSHTTGRDKWNHLKTPVCQRIIFWILFVRLFFQSGLSISFVHILNFKWDALWVNSSHSIQCFVEHFPEYRNYAICVTDMNVLSQIACFKGTSTEVMWVEQEKEKTWRRSFWGEITELITRTGIEVKKQDFMSKWH